MTAARTDRAVSDTRGWAEHGTRVLLDAADRLADTDLEAPSALPGWSRRHVLAHVASNAEAIGRLLTWARTGIETPMYASPDQRAADIETGATRTDLRDWTWRSADQLATAMDELPAPAWSTEVVTAQGRTVPASETPWMRARETCVHAVDLAAGVSFDDLPEGFLAALVDDVVGWRSARSGPAVVLVTPDGRRHIAGEGDPADVELPLATAAAWLVGRLDPATEPALPELPRWL